MRFEIHFFIQGRWVKRAERSTLLGSHEYGRMMQEILGYAYRVIDTE